MGGWVSRIFRKLVQFEAPIKMTDSKRIAIIGGGPCGITAAKSCLEEGLEVVVFDRSDGIGGLWCYREDDNENLPSVMKSTVINTSKEMSAFSDFCPPKHYPNFMHNSYMLQYFRLYAEKFGILPHVQLRTEVIDVSPTDDYERNGTWAVTTKKTDDGQVSKETFDGVLVAIGHHCYPYMPEMPGLDTFKGQVMHTHSLKKANGFEDKKVLVVGIGNSAVDAAVELSTVAQKVYLSTRRGAWLFRRVGPNGKPYDAAYTKKGLNFLRKISPFSAQCWYIERELNGNFNHKTYGLKPEHRVLEQHPTINDALPNKILSGTVILKGDVKEFTENAVVFKGEKGEIEIDAVIMATGYKIKFPFLSEDIISVSDNQVELYKYMFPPHLTHPSLAAIGLVQVVGAVFPVAEAQSRWYAMVMTGKKKLPSKEVMLADIRAKNKANRERYVASPRHTIQVEYVDYQDELAELIGCKPNLTKLFFTDPKLFWRLIVGPSLPYQYRLQGPHPWAGAREAIMEYEDRVLAALNTRKRPQNSSESKPDDIH